MPRRSTSWSHGCCILCLILAGCASNGSKVDPSMAGGLKGEVDGLKGKAINVEHASYVANSDDELGTKKIKHPLKLKLHYAKVMEEFENYPDAKFNYSAVLEEQPENFEAVIGLARVEQAVGEYQKAEMGFRKALALQPDSAVAQHALGQFHLAQGNFPEALPLLNKAVLAHPHELSYRYDLAVALAESGDINAALPHFKRAIGDAAAHHNVATILRQNGNFHGAEQHYRQALSIQPELEESRNALASLYDQRDAHQQYAGNTSRGSAAQGAPNRVVNQASHQVPARPMNTHRPTAQQTPRHAMTPRTTTAPSQPLTQAQLEQRRNQQPFGR